MKIIGARIRRDFEKGTVTVNPRPQPATVTLTGEYYRVSSTVTIAPQDAAFLFKE
jgi:hypothetical protein